MITHIVHLSDVHIRRGNYEKSRYDEYKGVFLNLFLCLDNMGIQWENLLIVLTGDIFHDKGVIEPCGIDLFNVLVHGLAKRGKVVIIAGNHDMRQEHIASNENGNKADLIGTLKGAFPKDVWYLDKTGVYEFDNVGIGLVVIDDILDKGNTTGLSQTLPEFPKVSGFSDKVSVKIALSHLAVKEFGMFGSNDLPSVNWFCEYDVAMLGDIHKRKCARGNGQFGRLQWWGYAGSLIQQNFGESLEGHGLLLWNVEHEQIEVDAIDVKNDYGYLLLASRLESKELEQFIAKAPNKIHVRLRLEVKNVAEDCMVVEKIAKKYGKTILSMSHQVETKGAHTREAMQCGGQVDLSADINSVDSWLEYVKAQHPTSGESVIQYLRDMQLLCLDMNDLENNVPIQKMQQINNRNLDLKKGVIDVQSMMDHLDNKGHKPLKFKMLSWDWVLCYGSSNVFDFGNIESSIALLNGKNASGKSSFVEIIVLALFGEGIPSRSNKHFSARLVHHDKPLRAQSSVQLAFLLGDEEFTIIRKFKKNKNKIVMESILQGGRDAIVQKQNAVNKWIKENIGSIDEFLTTCISTQDNDMNFFAMKSTEQRALLEQVVKMDSVNVMSDILKEAVNLRKYVLDTVSAIKEEVGQVLHDADSVALEKQQLLLMSKKRALDEKKTSLEADNALCQEHFQMHDSKALDYLGDADNLAATKKRIQTMEMELEALERLEGVEGLEGLEGVEGLEGMEGLARSTEERIGSIKTEINMLTVLNDKQDILAFDKESLCRHLERAPEKPQVSMEFVKDRMKKYGMVLDTTSSQENETLHFLEERKAELQDKLQNLLERRPRACKETRNTIEAFSQEYRELNSTDHMTKWAVYMKYADDLGKIKSAFAKLQEVAATLEENEEHPFNPDCWACCQQPWYVFKCKVEANKKALEDFLKKPLEEGISIDQISTFEKWHARYLYAESKVDYYKEEEGILVENEEWAASVGELKEKVRTTEMAWLQKLAFGVSQWHNWDTDHKRLLLLSQDAENYRQRLALEEELMELERRLANSKKQEKLMKMVSRDWQLLLSKPYYDRYQRNMVEQRNIEKLLVTVEADILDVTRTIERQEKAATRYQVLASLQGRLEMQLRSLSCLYSSFEGKDENSLKGWIHSQKVIPFLMQMLNPIIAHFGLFLSIEHNDNRYDFMVHDGYQNSILDRSSGFQKFVISLAFRVVLSQLSEKTKPRQFILDEGFTSCDDENIMKMPNMIREFLSYFDSILLISHLDTIVDMVDIKIPIKKVRGQTLLNFK